MQRTDVEFESQGATLRGWRYEPDGPGPHPAVVMAPGLTAVKEMFLDDYAARFCAAGFMTLAYDHPGFGASGGTPRQCADPYLQIQGYRDAIAWLRTSPAIDPHRVGAWGSSFAGGEVIVLAAEDDAGVAAAVAQVPYLEPGSASLSNGVIGAITTAFLSGDLDRCVPAVCDTADGFGLMHADGASAWFTRVAAERAPAWRNEICLRGVVACAAYQPVDHLARVRVPLLLLPAAADTLTPAGEALARAGPLPATVSIVTLPGNHFDAYGASFEAGCAEAIAFFTTHLRP
jgi:hypothetical protein